MNKQAIYHYIWIMALLLGSLNSHAQFASIEVIPDKNSPWNEDLECFWVSDNFEYYNHTPIQKKQAPAKGFRFTIPFEGDTTIRYITIKTGGMYDNEKILIQDYLVEPGDHVVIKPGATDIRFDGPGAEKFKLQYQLNFLKEPLNAIQLKRKDPAQYASDKMEGLDPALQSTLESSLSYQYGLRDTLLSLVEVHKYVLSGQVYGTLRANIIGEREAKLLTNLDMTFYARSNANPKLKNQKKLLLAAYQKRKTRLEELSADDYAYANGIELYIATRVKKKKWFEGVFSDDELYAAVNKKNLDRALYRMLFMNYSKMDEEQQNELISHISNDQYRVPFQAFKEKIKIGKPIPNFVLQDTLGNQVELASLKGKVVLLDFWFTGCVNCKALQREMAPIRAYFRDNENVIFVSISIDSDFEKFKSSARSGEYSDPSDITLYTMGQRTGHPIIKFFNVIGFPRQVILDKRLHISSTNVPRPGSLDSPEVFIKLITDIL